MEIKKCLLINNPCYKSNQKMTPKGIVVHSTGAVNKTLRRYLSPDDGIIGKNSYNNHWNKSSCNVCVHGFIGVDKNNIVRTYQSLPWNVKCWGCGKGRKGSYNNNYIQFEVCEGSSTDLNYYKDAIKQAKELCAFLCKKYNIPVENIVSHAEAHKLGYASNHSDIDSYMKNFNDTMDNFREDVKSLLSKNTTSTSTSPSISASKTFKVGDTVKIISGAKYTNGKLIPKWITEKTLYIRQIKGNNAVISTLKTGAVTGVVNLDYLVKDRVASDSISSYRIRVTTDKLNIRKGAGTNYAIIGTITDKGVYTIVEEATGQGATSWLKLKSGGYISADYVKKI